MGIEFPTNSDACDNYGYTYDSSCTADGGTLGYDQSFVYTELPDGTRAWIPLNGVLGGLIGADGFQGTTGPPVAIGNQGFQGPTGEKGEAADVGGGQGEQGNDGNPGVDFPARGGDSSPQTSFRYNIKLGDPYTAKQINSSVISLNSTSLDKCFNIWHLSCVLTAAELINLKLFLSIHTTVKSVSIPPSSFNI